ncbi:hypothetical protein EVAR_66609_1 [Eumeta japonica]|uniref:Uncharacterized protein n=1 Tax=Eumeta variegata TaxID=151549 RepID=A0A4C2A7V8_EUMVA|nr:hypothetical protein EVAR_66609_1 [Eumeta japonica]
MRRQNKKNNRLGYLLLNTGISSQVWRSSSTSSNKDIPTLRLIPIDNSVETETDKLFVEDDKNTWVIVKVEKTTPTKKRRELWVHSYKQKPQMDSKLSGE